MLCEPVFVTTTHTSQPHKRKLSIDVFLFVKRRNAIIESRHIAINRRTNKVIVQYSEKMYIIVFQVVGLIYSTVMPSLIFLGTR